MTALALLLLTAAPSLGGENFELLGFTKDGAKLVWLTGSYDFECKQEQCDAGDEELVSTTYRAVVHDVVTEAQQVFKVETRPAGKGAPKRLADFAAFEKWKKDNPLVSSKKAPAGASAGVRVGKEEKTEFAEEEEEAVFYTSRGGEQVTLTATMGGMTAMFSPSYAVTWVWDPSGKRVAFIETRAAAHTMRGPVPSSSTVRLLGLGPVVSVLATDDAKGARDEAIAKIEGAGFAVTSKGVAQKARTATVVYSDKAHAAAAQKLATALGGTVDTLTWKSKEPLVVAVGVPTK